MPKSTTRIIFPRGPRSTTSGNSSTFWQSVLLVAMGAIISFFSTIGTAYFSARNEAQKMDREQKIAFEKDLVSQITHNLTILKSYDNTNSYLYKDDSLAAYSAKFKITNITLTMSAYVGKDICDRFKALTDTLQQLNFSVRTNISYKFRQGSKEDYYNIIKLENSYGEFMRDFHTAILK